MQVGTVVCLRNSAVSETHTYLSFGIFVSLHENGTQLLVAGRDELFMVESRTIGHRVEPGTVRIIHLNNVPEMVCYFDGPREFKVLRLCGPVSRICLSLGNLYMSCLVLSCLVLSCLVLSCLVLSCLVLLFVCLCLSSCLFV
jgi:hypothetical protein